MCEHCETLKQVLTELTGEKVAGVIMRRAAAKLHPLSIETASRDFLVITA
jgi:hypothetical protein